MRKLILVIGICLSLICVSEWVLAAETDLPWPEETQHVMDWKAWDEYFKNTPMAWQYDQEEVDGNGINIEISATTGVKGEYTEYGIWIWDEDGNLVFENSEDFYTPREELIVWYRMNGFDEDTDYTYQLYVVYEGECYYSPFREFKTGTAA